MLLHTQVCLKMISLESRNNLERSQKILLLQFMRSLLVAMMVH